MTRSKTAFFHRPETHDLIAKLARAPSLTIFVGAGVSLDRGSPDWPTLLRTLLADLLATNDKAAFEMLGTVPSNAVRRETAEQIGLEIEKRLETLPLASVVVQLYERFKVDPRRALYADVQQVLYADWEPGGPLAHHVLQLAVLWRLLGRDVAIITTNFDENIELSGLDDPIEKLRRAVGLKIVSRVSYSSPAVLTEVPVYHLHGLVPQRGIVRG